VSTLTPGELQALAPFRELDPRRLETLVGCVERERHPAGAMLLRQGDAVDRLHLIRSGSVVLELDVPGRPPLLVETLGAGEWLGVSWLGTPARVHFDARAREPVESLAFDTRCMERAMAADPVLGHLLCKRLSATLVRRLQAARLRLMDLYGHPGPFESWMGGGR